MSPRTVAIVGATGAVGEDLLAVLERRRFPVRELRLLASPRSTGRTMRYCGEDVPVLPLVEEAFEGCDLALFSAGSGVAREWAPRAVARGCTVVDNSSAFRMDPQVPLVVPEVNADALAAQHGIIANPNCCTILLVLALGPLHRAAGLRAVQVATYQAASGAGRRAQEELIAATRACLDGLEFAPVALPHSLAFNLFPRVDAFQPDGYTKEEDKMRDETRKILGLPDLPVEATCVRVPVERCHSEAIAVHLVRELAPDAAREVFAGAPGLIVEDQPSADRYPQPRPMTGRDEVAVGRVRESRVFRPGLSFFLAGDQLRKGAALNAVQIAEALSA